MPRTMSAEGRAKLSAALKGKRHPHRGHAIDEATRAKISEALRRHYGTEDQPPKKRRRRRGDQPARGRRKAAQHAPRARGKHLRGHSTQVVRAPGGGRFITGHKGHKPHRSAFSKISSGAGYHHQYTGRLRALRRHKTRGRLRIVHPRVAHHVRPKRT